MLEMDKEKARAFSEEILKAWDKASENAKNGEGVESDSKSKKSIVILDNGKVYVKAARRVITANDLSGRRGQITQFFSSLLNENSVLPIPTIDGNTLYITKNETAFKARDNYVVINGNRVKLSEDEYLAKLNAESHIDELAEVSVPQNSKARKDNKNHNFAKRGFNYRTVYFEDFDGKYYQVTLSVGNDSVATVYNVSLKNKGNAPVRNIISAIGSKTVGAFPNISILPDTQKSNPDSKNSLDVNAGAYNKAAEQGDEAKAQQYVDAAAMRWGAYSADDDDGNIIPLDERFSDSKDIRFSRDVEVKERRRRSLIAENAKRQEQVEYCKQ